MKWCGAAVLVLVALYDGVRSLSAMEYDPWITFKTKYNKQYQDETEESYRWNVWKDNTRLILEHNTAADNGAHTFWLAENNLADMTTAEVEESMMGLNVDVDDPDVLYYPPEDTVGLPEDTSGLPESLGQPASVDWTTKGYVTPVKNQGMCGSCYAFSSTGFSGGTTLPEDRETRVSLRAKYRGCSRHYGNHGCHGGTMNKAFNYIIANGGDDTEASYPYKGTEGNCRYSSQWEGATARGYNTIPRGDELALQAAVGDVGPVSVGMDARGYGFHFYSHGVYNPRRCSSRHMTHALLATGFGETHLGQPFWTVKNSWGTSWGMDGYFRIARGRGNLCGIASMASYPVV